MRKIGGILLLRLKYENNNEKIKSRHQHYCIGGGNVFWFYDIMPIDLIEEV